MRVLVVAAPLIGHLLPMLPLARALRAAGHEVLIATAGDALSADTGGINVIDLVPGFRFGRVATRTALAHPRLARAELAGEGGTRAVGLLFGAAAARELVRSGMGTPQRMLDATWQQRVDALGRAHYSRYDESTATALGDGARLLLDDYRGDLRRLRDRASGDPARIRELLTGFPRLGPVGADIFCREAQAIWPELRPALDGKTLDGARRLGLPADADSLAELVPTDETAHAAAALVRVALDGDLADQVVAAAG